MAVLPGPLFRDTIPVSNDVAPTRDAVVVVPGRAILLFALIDNDDNDDDGAGRVWAEDNNNEEEGGDDDGAPAPPPADANVATEGSIIRWLESGLELELIC